MDIGLLYDPHRPSEVHFVEDFQRRLTEHTSMRIRRNFPYRGVADGHATALRRLFSQDQYVGIEIEVNQSLYQSERCALWKQVWLPRLEEALQFCTACHR
jgi:predicted N-formylglutamate amidohydrolase